MTSRLTSPVPGPACARGASRGAPASRLGRREARRLCAVVFAIGALVLDAGVARAAVRLDAGVAFHYGRHVPVAELGLFSVVVLDPDRVDAGVAVALAGHGVVPAARIVASSSPPQRLRAQAIALRAAGFAGALLVAGDRDSAAALTTAITTLRDVWPDGPLLLEADPRAWPADFPAAASGVTALVAGPLFWRFDPATRTYQTVNEDARAAWATTLRAFASRAGVPVVVVEAAPASARADYHAIAEKVAALGFVPWVAPASRDAIGCGLVEPVPRRVLVVVDGAEEPYLPFTVAHRMAALPLEYLGFAVDYADVRSGLPTEALGDRYAGVVTWFTDDDMPAPRGFEHWLAHQIDDGIHVAILGHLGFAPSDAFLKRLGIEVASAAVKGPVHIVASDNVVGFEESPAPRARELRAWTSTTLTRHLDLVDGDGRRVSPVMEGAWGGIALDPYLTAPGFEGRLKWIVDPFRFLASALRLPAIPAPDPTTENGRRLLEIHVDGDAFPSRSEIGDHAFAGEVIRREFLARYRLPVTVSVIEGEIAATGLHPADSPALESIARAIFALPNVEIASHSYSHPFDWLRAGRAVDAENAAEGEAAISDEPQPAEGDRLQVPGYTYSVTREVDGSVHYIDTHLAPPGKATRVFLWSGTALPPVEALERTDALGIENVNGDDAEEPAGPPTLAQVPSFTRPIDGRVQIYAAGQNENVFTNLWHGPYYGYRRVIDIFRFTESPRRLKPIAIYYHFYSGTKAASVKALHEVYDWALGDETFPVWTSEYAARVRGFDQATLARTLDGGWLLAGFGALHTVRLAPELGWPDVARSRGVLGVRDLPQGRYVALAASTEPVPRAGQHPTPAMLFTRPEAPTGPYLEAANGAVVDWSPDGNTVRMRIRAHVPAEISIGGCAAPRANGAEAFTRSHDGRVTARGLRFATDDTGEVDVVCK